MNTFKDDSQELYQAYYSIDVTAFRERVRFYDEHRDLLSHLTVEQRILIDIDYHLALFEIGKYGRFLRGVDPLIEAVIIDGLAIEGVDIYSDLLFKKAASHYNLWRLRECEYVLEQLLRMDPTSRQSKELYYHCRCKADRKWYHIGKAYCVVVFLVGVVLVVASKLVVQPFYYQYYEFISALSTVLIGSCVIGLIANEVMLKWSAKRDVDRLCSTS